MCIRIPRSPVVLLLALALTAGCSGSAAEPTTSSESTSTVVTAETSETSAATTTLASTTTLPSTTTSTTAAAATSTTVTTTTTVAPATTAAPTTSTTVSTTTTTLAPTTTTAQPEALRITIANFAFSGDTSGSVGDTVTVVNNDSVTHTWTATGGAFNSGNLSGGDTFSFTFQTAGTYAFFCQIHPSMAGSIAVSG